MARLWRPSRGYAAHGCEDIGEYPIANFRSVQRHIDIGRGHAGRVLGPPFNVYRIQDNAAVNYLDSANLIKSRFPILRRVLKGLEHKEGPDMGSMFFEMIADMSKFVTGDVFIEQDPFYGTSGIPTAGDVTAFPTPQFNGICLASHMPVRKNIGARVNRLGIVFRQAASIDDNGYWAIDMSSAQPLQLRNGAWVLSTPQTANSLIPMGVSASERFHGELISDLPGSTPRTRWMIFVPALEGFQFIEGDFIATLDQEAPVMDYADVIENGSRYRVVHPFGQESGLVGNQLLCERIGQN